MNFSNLKLGSVESHLQKFKIRKSMIPDSGNHSNSNFSKQQQIRHGLFLQTDKAAFLKSTKEHFNNADVA